jgi:hypothetical protein
MITWGDLTLSLELVIGSLLALAYSLYTGRSITLIMKGIALE